MSQEPLVDLPLPGEAEKPPSRRGGPPPPAAPGRRRWWIPLAVIAAAVVGYLAPRPGPPVVAAVEEPVVWPDHRVGAPAVEWPVELRNDGRRSLEFLGLGLEGERVDAFEVIGDECSGRRLPGGETCRVLLSFAPTTAGEHEVRLVVDAEAANAPYRVALRGNAIEPRLAFAPGRLALPSLLVGET
ncbi:MAG: hypothetical protein R3190_04415 [Thermoanaerobaculia bacterium]|nr:hypothetical protein [Thermoanaerobaculia bacterium]